MTVQNSTVWRFDKTFQIDSLAKEYGHTLLRLPSYYYIFNPTEIILHELKSHVSRQNTVLKFSDSATQTIQEVVAKVTANNWSNCVHHVMTKKENLYSERLVAELIIQLGDGN